MFDLTGKVAFITGAGSGIGEAIAKAFAAQGARVVVADISSDDGLRVVSEIGEKAQFRLLDVRDTRSVEIGLNWCASELGSLDVLVNNAGLGFVGSVEETKVADFCRLQDVNVNGVFYGCKFAVPIMLRQGRGNIINIGSVAGLVGIERRFAYCATKGAVIAMTRQLAIDYASKGIRANCICPGTIHTPFVDGYLREFHSHEMAETIEKLNARQPLGRMGEPADVAAMAVYLAADESAFATGSVLNLDGGWTAR